MQAKTGEFRGTGVYFLKSLQNAKENLIGVLENKTEFFIQHKV